MEIQNTYIYTSSGKEWNRNSQKESQKVDRDWEEIDKDENSLVQFRVQLARYSS